LYFWPAASLSTNHQNRNLFKNKYLFFIGRLLLIALPAAQTVYAQRALALAALPWSPQKNVAIGHGFAPRGSNDKRARGIEKALAEAKLIPTSMTVVSQWERAHLG
jgi:hypothetical protein